MCLRLYAVTGRSKVYAVILAVMLVAQLGAGISLTVVAGIHPSTSLNRFSPCVRSQICHQSLRSLTSTWTHSGSAFLKSGDLGRPLLSLSQLHSVRPHTSLAQHFNASFDVVSRCCSHWCASQIFFALVTIFSAARGTNARKYPGIPNLLKLILRDATIYFTSMFACQLLLLFFLFLAPVR
jgi:hypothetical protein